MAFGKLYTKEGNPRTTAIAAVAKANGLDLETVLVDTQNPTPEFLAANPLARVPSFVGSDGYNLTECMAIAIYITSQNEKTTLLGKTKQDYASILKWMSYANTEILMKLAGQYRPLLGMDPYNKKAIDDAATACNKIMKVFEEHLVNHTYLVGERITLADLFTAGIVSRGFQFFYGKEWRSENPATTRWFQTVTSQPIYTAVAEPLEFLDAPKLVNVPPKKEEKPKPAPKAAAPAAAAPADDTPAPAPKPKHPCDLLPKSSYGSLDDLKRHYSNQSEESTMEYLWKTIPWEDYSLWKLEYKYNDELTLVFMSSNLIGGLFARLEGSRKYIFGCANVFGENNDSIIEGAFIIRGQEFEPCFDVAPDYESYSFTKLDPNNPEDREYVYKQWKGDMPITKNGKDYKYADGKCFK